jgi:hypothetical protein
MKDRLDFEVVDLEALSEIRLTADLMIAASESPRRLSQHAIDCVLGLGAIGAKQPRRGRGAAVVPLRDTACEP